MINVKEITVKRILLVGMLAGTLSLLACDSESCSGSDFVQNFKEVTGVDLNKPADVVKVAASGDTVGNETQNEALETASRNVAQVVYTKWGEDHDAEHEWTLAIADYSSAISQTRTDTDSGKQKVQELYIKMARDYTILGLGNETDVDFSDKSDKATIYKKLNEALFNYTTAEIVYKKAANIATERLELNQADQYVSLANNASAAADRVLAERRSYEP